MHASPSLNTSTVSVTEAAESSSILAEKQAQTQCALQRNLFDKALSAVVTTAAASSS
jgi:hypothetical protein